MPVLDTSFLIDISERHPAAQNVLRKLKQDDLRVPWHAAVEFLVGCDDPIAALRILESGYQIIYPENAHLLESARLRRQSLVARRKSQWGDIHVACEALLCATYVVTADPGDFEALGCPAWDYRRTSKPPT